GAFEAQLRFGLPSIGGKDSMSGTFNDIDVPPTLVSFAVDVAKASDIITPEIKKAGNILALLKAGRDEYDLPEYDKITASYDKLHKDIKNNNIVSAYAIDGKGVIAALSRMAFGNGLGIKLNNDIDLNILFGAGFGSIVAEVAADRADKLEGDYIIIGKVTDEPVFTYGDVSITEAEALAAWKAPLEKVFPTKAVKDDKVIETKLYMSDNVYICKHKVAKPTVFIPVFPGTNCEYDSAKAFERAGADVITKVFKNLSAEDIRSSVDEFRKGIDKAQIIMFPGGFSAGDEPDGSAKFFATAFQNEVLKEAVMQLLNERDGLALGICNGFQALIKLGLVPGGMITGQDASSPTLTFNTINRHVSKMVYTKVVSDKSPWLKKASLGGMYVIPASHGEGRFVANDEWLDKLFANGQVATQYCDVDGNISMDEEWNVNGSYMSIEGITSPDGRCFGKMGHAERRGDSVAMNIYGDQDMQIFESGVEYFK
ncbi:MAG: phosphoribosylformylglycinamidine synthase subunit PurQ, partial [Lachnospiraceae bacterium]|nr:phosphoribosylformylglycinamidine synthase subunit PurQ [Lachnospiraceae bacterium]